MTNTYRIGGLGAMMDEYDRAAAELAQLLETVDDSGFIAEHPQEAENCRSIQKIMRHVVRAAYGFANDIRGALNIPVMVIGGSTLLDKSQSIASLQEALKYTDSVVEGKWSMSEAEIERITMPTPWGTTYTPEQMLQHAQLCISCGIGGKSQGYLIRRFSAFARRASTRCALDPNDCVQS